MGSFKDWLRLDVIERSYERAYSRDVVSTGGLIKTGVRRDWEIIACYRQWSNVGLVATSKTPNSMGRFIGIEPTLNAKLIINDGDFGKFSSKSIEVMYKAGELCMLSYSESGDDGVVQADDGKIQYSSNPDMPIDEALNSAGYALFNLSTNPVMNPSV